MSDIEPFDAARWAINPAPVPRWEERYYRRDGSWTTDIGELAFRDAREKYVAKTEVDFVFGGAPMMVSTVFLTIDHDYSGEGPPILFETMVFGLRERYGEEMERYCTEAEALAGHAEMVRKMSLHGIRRTRDVLEREIAKAEKAMGR